MVESWFPTLVYSDNIGLLKEYNNDYAERIYQIKKVQDSVHTWKCDTYSSIGSEYKMVDDPVFFNLFQEVKNRVCEFSKNYGIETNEFSINLTDAWFNIASPGQYQEFHIHAYNHFSVVYYVKTPKKCGNILFRNQEHLIDMMPLPVKKPTLASYQTVFYEPEESNLLIFRSNLNHMVEKNMSDEDRISIAMNFVLKT
jgi:uncharacterized protein (TIGR02466 family)